jgi:hypothetical protein
MILLAMKLGFTAFTIFVLALCVYFPFGWLLHHRLATGWRYRRHRDQFVEHTAIVTNEDVMVASFHAAVRLNWDRLAFIVSTPHGLLFVIPPHAAWFWLPQRLFDGNDHKESILALATEHKVPIRRMA